MQNILTELWNGNIFPAERSGAGDPEAENLVRLIEQNRARLEQQLQEDERQVLDNYAHGWLEYLNIQTEHAFCDGFRLACRLLTAAYTE